MKSKKGFTLIELMVVVLIVGILAAVAIPILRGRIDAAKWSEGKAMMGSIATAFRAYAAEKGPAGANPTGIIGDADTTLGFAAGDLTGTYFQDGDFSITNMDMGASPVEFTITCTTTKAGAPENPDSLTLDQTGSFDVPVAKR